MERRHHESSHRRDHADTVRKTRRDDTDDMNDADDVDVDVDADVEERKAGATRPRINQADGEDLDDADMDEREENDKATGEGMPPRHAPKRKTKG
jgi:hypothetical protein